jgi:DNA-binding transcriptional MocR family regulator
MYMAVELPEQLSPKRVFDAALKQGILIALGLMFSNSKRFEHFIRINCGWPFSPEIDRALQSLGKLIDEMSSSLSTAHSA